MNYNNLIYHFIILKSFTNTTLTFTLLQSEISNFEQCTFLSYFNTILDYFTFKLSEHFNFYIWHNSTCHTVQIIGMSAEKSQRKR